MTGFEYYVPEMEHAKCHACSEKDATIERLRADNARLLGMITVLERMTRASTVQPVTITTYDTQEPRT